jgi:hypothetical protein
MTDFEIIKGTTLKPRRVLVYGRHGAGKSTWASSAPKPIVIQTEDGCNDIGPDRLPLATTYEELFEQLRWLYKNGSKYESIVIDSADWMEKLIHKWVATQNGLDSVSDIPYGKGYEGANDELMNILGTLDTLQVKHGCHVIFTAHARIVKFDDPQSDSYDRYAPALHVNGRGAGACVTLQEWCDEVMFLTEKTLTREVDKGFGNKAHKAIGTGDRILYTCSSPAFDAKSRLTLPDELPAPKEGGWEVYAGYFHKEPVVAKATA